VKPIKLVKLLANLGYGSRREVSDAIRACRVSHVDARKLSDDLEVCLPGAIATKGAKQCTYDDLRVDGAALDPPPGSVILLHKPVGYTCSTSDAGSLIYDLLPPRFRQRDPVMSSIGRLDRDTSGLLLLTDDGALLHRIISPKKDLPKTYRATLAQAFTGNETSVFASGALTLHGETTPLKPAVLEAISDKEARLTITEGRYHQIRRMFACTGNHVDALHRESIGGLSLGDLPEGQWRVLRDVEVDLIFAATVAMQSQR
jgi:16S rRNA pseudouridine516 synthase